MRHSTEMCCTVCGEVNNLIEYHMAGYEVKGDHNTWTVDDEKKYWTNRLGVTNAND